MEQVYLLYSCDTWHTHASKDLLGVFTTREGAIKTLCAHFKVLKEMAQQLRDMGQTQSTNVEDFDDDETPEYEGDGQHDYTGEFILDTAPLNHMEG
jgi:antirestriction protein